MLTGEPVAASVGIIVTLLFAVAFAAAIGGYVAWIALKDEDASDPGAARLPNEAARNSPLPPIRRWAGTIAGVILVVAGLILLLDPEVG
jgi:hypothetical protein